MMQFPAANNVIGAAFLGAMLLAGAGIASPARADPLTFEQAISRARANAPSLRAQALGANASRAARIAAGSLPDPKLSLGVDSFPISGPLAFQPSRDNFTWVRVGLAQDIPNLTKRRAQRIRADADIAVAEASALLETRTVEVNTAIAWVTLAMRRSDLPRWRACARSSIGWCGRRQAQSPLAMLAQARPWPDGNRVPSWTTGVPN